jgi:hypothetical protein
MGRSTPYRVAVLALAIVVAGCGAADPPTGAPTPTAAPTTSAAPLPAPTAAPSPTTRPTAEPFAAETVRVAAADLPKSWRSGCPVDPASLRMLRLTHWGFDDRPHRGAIVVHRDAAADVTRVFRTLYDARFPIRRLEPVDAYGGSDDASMAADNTSGFNCRKAVASGNPGWSLHAYGRAVDVNPVENPYLLDGRVLPPEGARYVDRSPARPGMAVRGGVLVKAFAAAGWTWAGARGADPDYQHFSTTGG